MPVLKTLSSNFNRYFLFSWIFLLNPAQAEIIEQKLNNGVIATADFHQGDSDAPAVLILHGFLQTRSSHTVAKLYNALVDSGYTVLAPTLSLNISRRKQSLACEAIHTHSLQSDIAEIDLWSRWLSKKYSGKIILIGHSAGSVLQVSYLGQYPYEHIDQGIFISLSYFGVAPASNETVADSLRARSSIERGKKGIEKYGLSYCKEYATTAENYLSYYVWQPEKLLTTMKNIKIPITAIIGSQDQRISKSWVTDMKKSKINIVSIEGAGHFFDNEYEFDLQDSIESILSQDEQ